MIRFLLLGLLTTTLGFAQLNDNDRQELLQKNILVNAGFENGKQRWTASGGTFTAITSGVGTGKGAVTWDSSSASQTLTSTAVTLPSGFYGKNGVASCAIKGAAAVTHTIQAYDGTNILASQTITSSTTAFARSSVNFIMPSSGSISLRIVSVASNEASISVDDCFLGLAEGFNIGDVSQATLVGTLKYAATNNCQWSGSSGSFANFSADTDCPSASVTGNASAPGTKIPAIVLNNLPPGKYLVNFQGKVYSSAALGACSYRLSDGTNVSGNSASYLGSAGTAGPISALALSGVFDYSVAQSSVTIQAQQMLYSGGGSCNINNDVTSSGDFEVQVFRFPSATEQAYRPESQDQYGSLTYAAASNCSWVTSSGSYTNLSADTDCSTPTVSGVVSAPGTKIPGFVVNNLPAGKYLVTAQGKIQNDGSGNACYFRLHDGTNASGYGGVYESTGTIKSPMQLAGVFTYSSSQSSLTIQIQGAESGNDCYIENNQAGLDLLQFQIIPIQQNIPAPLLVGSVTSSSTGAERIERASFTCSGSSSLSNNSPGITAIAARSTAGCAITLSGFSSTPVCIVARNQTTTASEYAGLQVTSSTSVTVYNSTASDWAGHIVCMGSR